MGVLFGVLGPVTAWDDAGDAIALKGPKHRAVLARLIVARGRVVPVTRLVDDLWTAPPPEAVGAVRTFVAALRRTLEPERPPRAPSRTLVTEGPGYALRARPDDVDAWRFEQVVAASRPPQELVASLDEALGWWRGPAYADFAEEGWARAERSRLTELRLRAVERRAEAMLALGRAAETVPDLDAHVAEHPWREDAWRLLALGLYRTGRQGDALAVLRRARTLLVQRLGVDPGPALRRLEEDILRQADDLQDAAAQVWARAAAAYDRTVASGARARLESTVGILRNLAVTGGGGLEAAREQRMAAVAAAEELGDAELTARVIGAYDVPAIWTRSDDPGQAAEVVAAAERTLAALPFIVQFVAILFVSDFSEYWIHRCMHRVPWLWRFHAIHHSIEKMDWLAASRLHLLDIVIVRGVTFIPLFILGFANGPVFAYLVFVSFHAIFIHANVNFRFGWLDWLIATPRFHHWHHSAQPEAIDKNFAVHLPLLDRLFGTLLLPRGNAWPSHYGIAGNPVPEGYLQQMAYPIRRRKDST